MRRLPRFGRPPLTPAPGSFAARAVDAAAEASVLGSFSRLGPALRAPLFAWEPPPRDALAGRNVLVTGATSGLGFAFAEHVARLGATVHLVGRDADRLRSAKDRLSASVPHATFIAEQADLAQLDDMRALADRLTQRMDHLDVVAHIAGALVADEQRTVDGLELTLQVHVVAPFLLTSQLLPLLQSAGGRVITMSSGGMYLQRLDVDRLVHNTGSFDGRMQYARAKRAQVELNVEWARRHGDLGVGFHAMHPGWVDTPGLRSGLPLFAKVTGPTLRSPEQGVDTAVWLTWSTDAPAPGGDFWLDRARRHTTVPPWRTTPQRERDRLWETTAALARAGSDPA